MKKTILTGASGFVGANLAEKLVNNGHEVHLFLRSGYQTWRIKHLLPYIQIHTVNLLDQESLTAIIKSIRPNWIFHLATFGAYSWQDNSIEAINTNYLSTVNLIEASMKTGFESFINTGSSSEYGEKDHAPKEDEYLEPNSYYATTKAAATLFCRYTAQRTQNPIFTLRLYSVYGHYEDPNRLIPALITKGFKGKLPPLVHPEVARDFIFSEDICSAYLFVASSAGRLPAGSVYNVGTGVQTSIREIVSITREVFSISEEPTWGTMENRSWDTNIWVANNAKLCHAGWSPAYDFRTGYLRTIEWFNQNRLKLAHIYEPGSVHT
jgi:nucleoside-diphosphate-sugar epimerase